MVIFIKIEKNKKLYRINISIIDLPLWIKIKVICDICSLYGCY